MSAYLVVQTDIHDLQQYEHYKAAASTAIAQAGGRYLARGGELAVLEGDWRPSRLVLAQFDSLAATRAWYDSPAYEEARRLRAGAATMRMVAVAGAD
jgi:uncharacterized protein (DUF1330 family)